MVAPRIIQAADANTKMNAMAMMRFSIALNTPSLSLHKNSGKSSPKLRRVFLCPPAIKLPHRPTRQEQRPRDAPVAAHVARFAHESRRNFVFACRGLFS